VAIITESLEKGANEIKVAVVKRKGRKTGN
jgi:hypothetical protein